MYNSERNREKERKTEREREREMIGLNSQLEMHRPRVSVTAAWRSGETSMKRGSE